jgi:hypothetical protein
MVTKQGSKVKENCKGNAFSRLTPVKARSIELAALLAGCQYPPRYFLARRGQL